MKPSPSAPITEEDSWIWGWIYRKHVATGNALAAVSWQADRRDADLMFQAQQYRHGEFPVDRGPLAFALKWQRMCRRTTSVCIDFGGARWFDRADIIYCA